MAGDSGGRSVERFADFVLIAIALTMAAFYITGRPVRGVDAPRRKAPSDWRDEVRTGIRLGPAGAPLTVIEFMDMQCPFCAQWAARMDSLRAEYPNQVQVVFHHYPLSSHAHAMAAAVAVECAHHQGRSIEFMRVVFQQQPKIGDKPWREFAVESEVEDVENFDRCAGLPADSFPRIAHGMKLGRRSGVNATPTVWINGAVGQLPLDELRKMASNAKGSR